MGRPLEGVDQNVDLRECIDCDIGPDHALGAVARQNANDRLAAIRQINQARNLVEDRRQHVPLLGFSMQFQHGDKSGVPYDEIRPGH